MDLYLDIKDEIFQALLDNELRYLTLKQDLMEENSVDESMIQSLSVGDSVKLYHPSNPDEALRMQIDGREEMGNQVRFQVSKLEWIFQMETELDELLREEEKWLNDIF